MTATHTTTERRKGKQLTLFDRTLEVRQCFYSLL